MSARQRVGFGRLGLGASSRLVPLCSLSALLACTFVSTLAVAGPAPGEVAAVRSLWERARAAEEAERWRDCEQALRSAVDLMQTPGLLYHLAYCQEMQGHWQEAVADYRKAEALIHGGVSAPDVAELLGPTLARLELQMPSLQLVLEEAPPGTSLYISGKEFATRDLERALKLNPGPLTINIAAPGYMPSLHEISLLPGEKRVLRVSLVREAPPPPPPPPRPEATDIELRPYLLILEAGVTIGGGLAAGLFFYDEQLHATEARYWQNQMQEESSCSVNDTLLACRRNQAALDEQHAAFRNAWIGTSVAALGALSFVATLVFYPTSAAPVQVALQPTLGGSGVAVSGHF